MKLPDFEVEQWMNQYEKKARFNLTDTSVEALCFEELAELEPDALKGLKLDYGDITGDPRLKAEILSFYTDQSEDTLTTAQGCLQANEMVMECLIEPGDHVIAIEPGYQQFTDYPRSLQADVSVLQLNEKDWSLNPEDLKQALRPDTRLLILNNPSNPTGSYLDLEKMKEIVNICKKNGTWILCDEVYSHKGMPSFCDLYDKALCTGSLSKIYGLPGLRFGWIKGNRDIIARINSRRDYSIISTGPLIDTLAWIALKHQDFLLERSCSLIQKNKAVISNWLENQSEFSCILPGEGTVAFLHYAKKVPSKELALKLLEDTGIFFVPGSCFGKENYLRLGLGGAHEDLESVLHILSQYMEELNEEEFPKTASD